MSEQDVERRPRPRARQEEPTEPYYAEDETVKRDRDKTEEIAREFQQLSSAVDALEQFVEKVEGTNSADSDKQGIIAFSSLSSMLSGAPEHLDAISRRVLQATERLNSMLY